MNGIVFEDNIVVNPNLIRLKDLSSNEIKDFEKQEIPDNIVTKSKTPLNAKTLNAMVQSIDNSIADYETFKNDKIAEIDKIINDYKTKTDDALANLGNDFIKVVEVETWTIEEENPVEETTE